MTTEEPCHDCECAGQCGDGTWICLTFTRYLDDGQFFVSLIDENVDWENCPEYISPDDPEEDKDGEAEDWTE